MSFMVRKILGVKHVADIRKNKTSELIKEMRLNIKETNAFTVDMTNVMLPWIFITKTKRKKTLKFQAQERDLVLT
jgi:uncharacterized membrane protein